MKKPLRNVLPLLMLLSCIAIPARAQNLREMEFEELPSTGLIVDDPQAAVLVVETTIPGLSFQSRGGIRKVTEPESGIYRVFLTPGVHYVEIRAQGYLLLKLPRWNFPSKSGRKIRVRPRPQMGGAAAFDADRPRLRLDYAPGEQTEVYVQIDDNPPQKLDFSGGHVTLRPTPGKHTVQVYAGGRVWQRTLELAAGQSYQETVSMTEGARSDFEAGHPGNLFVESDPPGAVVYLNQVEQTGVTPLTLNDLQPGTYQIEGVLPLHLPASQQVVVRELEYANVALELTPNYGQVDIDSDPAGALIYLDGQQRGTTPFSAKLDPGVYPLRLVRALYHDTADSLHIEPGTQFSRTYPLRPNFGAVRVTSDPPGARVEGEGVSWGVTPVEREQVPSGRHLIRIELAPYPPQERTVQVRDGQTHAVEFDLTRSVGRLTIASDPPGAAVSIRESGRDLGRTPLRELPLSPGTYTLIFTLPDHDPVERRVPISPGDAPNIRVTLPRHTGHIRVETTPPRARIFLDQQAQGETPRVLRDLPTGQYQIRLEKEGYDPVVDRVVVKRNGVTDYRVTLGTAGTEAWKARRSRARKLALIPGLGQLSSPGQALRGLLYLAGIGAGGYLAYDARTAYDRADQDYQEALQSYRSTVDQRTMDLSYREMETAIDDMDSARNRFTISLAAAGGLYAVQFLDAFLFGGGRIQSPAQLSAVEAPGGMQLAMTPNGPALTWRF